MRKIFTFIALFKFMHPLKTSSPSFKESIFLFLTKTTYSTLLAILFLFVSMSYPFQPIQLSLVSTLNIGIPAFILALEPNKERVKGKLNGEIIKDTPYGIL